MTDTIAHQPHCPVCLAPDLKPYSAESWKVYGIDYGLVICGCCGSAHTSPMPDDQSLEKLYRTAFDYRWYQDHYDAKLRDCRIRVAEYRPWLGKRVLDFGGGVGYFSKAATEAGFDAITYDPFLSTESPDKRAWDSVIALHMLEHSNNLDRTITLVKEFLAPGGHALFAVPNFEGLGYRQLGMKWVWAQPPLLHIFHFTAAGLEKLLLRHGFSHAQISFHERWDANVYCDVDHVEHFRGLDMEWGNRFFNWSKTYRLWIARRNARLRFKGLHSVLQNRTLALEDRSELQIVATVTSQ